MPGRLTKGGPLSLSYRFLLELSHSPGEEATQYGLQLHFTQFCIMETQQKK